MHLYMPIHKYTERNIISNHKYFFVLIKNYLENKKFYLVQENYLESTKVYLLGLTVSNNCLQH